MKKILMVVTFLLMVAMVPAAHATLYTLEADQIWIDTEIDLGVGQSITFYGGQTHTTLSKIPTDRHIDRTTGWVPTGDGDFTRDQWTWGVQAYSPAVPYVWTGPNGGDGGWTLNGPYASILGSDPGLYNDEWIVSEDVPHGMLIGYIGDLKPLEQGSIRTGTDPITGDAIFYDPFQNNPDLFGIGTATVTIVSANGGHVWIGMNDDFTDLIEGIEDNFGYATVTVNVPEPASMLLLFFGLMGVLGLRRKFKS